MSTRIPGVEWRTVLVALFGGIFILASFINPIITSTSYYINYKNNADSVGSTNATVRKIEKQGPFLGFLGYCKINAVYEFTANGVIYTKMSHLNCREAKKLVIGNSISVKYDEQYPDKSASSVTLAKSVGEILGNARTGLFGLFLATVLLLRNKIYKT